MLVPLFFAHRLNDGPSLVAALAALAGFCLAASAVYVFNDIMDRAGDAAHPAKRARPIAAGQVSVAQALVFGLFLSAMTGLVCLLIFRAAYLMVILLYILLNLLYSVKLQRIPGVDAVCVAAGFVLRIFAGAVVLDVPVSGWLAGLTFLLALFLAASKRRCEIMAAGADANGTPGRAGIILLAVACLAGYVSYTLSPAVIREHSAPHLFLSSLWVALGIFRYLRIGLNPAGECSPVSIFLRDRMLQVFVLLWIGTLWWVMYPPAG